MKDILEQIMNSLVLLRFPKNREPILEAADPQMLTLTTLPASIVNAAKAKQESPKSRYHADQHPTDGIFLNSPVSFHEGVKCTKAYDA